MALLARPAIAVVNHVLADEEWARDRLRGFSGQTACLKFGSTPWEVKITPAGLFETREAESLSTVTIHFPGDALVRALTDRGSLLSSVTISGAADLAEALGFVLRNLRWDVENDLSQFVGDIAARRALQLARRVGKWQMRNVRNLGAAVTEYFINEQAAFAHSREIAAFCSDVDSLRDDLMCIEKRLEPFESLFKAQGQKK